MGYYSSKEIIHRVYDAAVMRANTSVSRTLALAFLAGAYIALGGLLAVIVSGGCPGLAATNPGLQKFLLGAAFPIGLMFCAIAGADLFTGNTAYFIPPVMSKKLTVMDMFKNWSLVYVGNFFGAIFVAYFLTYQTDLFDKDPWLTAIYHIAEHKTSATFIKTFLKGIGANWFVAIAMWMAYAGKDVISKIVAIWFPVMAFVTIGYEHSIANMFFIPTAIFYGAPISWGQFIVANLIPATLGNIFGGAVLVGLFYWFIYDRN